MMKYLAITLVLTLAALSCSYSHIQDLEKKFSNVVNSKRLKKRQFGNYQTMHAADNHAIRIDALLAETGDAGYLGRVVKAGIEKAAIDIKQNCQSLGTTCLAPELEYFNTKSSPNTALELFKKSYSKGVRFFVGLVTSDEAKVVAEYASQFATDAVLFSPTSTAAELCKYKNQLYRMTMDDRGYAEVLFDFVVSLQKEKFAIKVVYRNDMQGRGLYHNIVTRFKENEAIKILQPASYDVEGELTTPQLFVEQLSVTLPANYKEHQVMVVLVGLAEVERILEAAEKHTGLRNCIWMLSDSLTFSSLRIPASMDVFGLSFYGNKPESTVTDKEHHGLLSYVRDRGLQPMMQAFLAYDTISLMHLLYLKSQSFSQYLRGNLVSEGLTGAFEFSSCHERVSGSYVFAANPRRKDVDNVLVKVIMKEWLVISHYAVQTRQTYSNDRITMFEELNADAMMEKNLQITSKTDVTSVASPVIVLRKNELLSELVKIGSAKCQETAKISIIAPNEITEQRSDNVTFTVVTFPETVSVPARHGLIIEGSCVTDRHNLQFTRVCPSAKAAGTELICTIKISTTALGQAAIEGAGCTGSRIATGGCIAGTAGCFIGVIVTAGTFAPVCGLVGTGCAAIGFGSSIACSNGKYVCTELFRQGLLSSELLLADMSFAQHYSKEYPLTRQGYNIIGPALASWMSTSETVTNIVKSFAIPWAEEMAYNEGYRDEGNEVGAWVMCIGSVVCAIVGISYTYATYIIGWFVLVVSPLILKKMYLYVQLKKKVD